MSHPRLDQNRNISLLREIAFDVDTESRNYAASDRARLYYEVIRPLQRAAESLASSPYGLTPDWDALDKASMRASVSED